MGENEKTNIDNRYAALSSTEEDADFESQKYGSAGYGVGIRVGGELALRRLKNCDNLDEGLGRIILLEQDSGNNYSPGDAPAGISTKARQERQYADADAAGSDGWKKKILPRLSDFIFSFPSPLTDTTRKTTRGVATTRTRTRTIAAAASLLDPPAISYSNRCIVGDGNNAVVLSPPSSRASFTCHSHVLFRGEESAEQKLFPSSLVGEKDISRRYLSNMAISLSQTSSASSRAILSSRPAAVPPPAQEAPLRPCIPLSSKLIPILAKGRIPVTPPRPCYNQLPLPKFIPQVVARKLATQGQRIPVCLPASIIDITAPSLFSIDVPARMDKAREKRKGEAKELGRYYRRSSSAVKRNYARIVKKKMKMMRGGSWLEQELLRMWKESGDSSSSSSSPSTITTPTALIGSERRRPGMLKISRVFSTMTGGGVGGEDDARVVDAGWIEYVMISPPINYEKGQRAVGNCNEKFEVPVITSIVTPARFEDEDNGTKKVTGNDNFAGGKGKEGEVEGLLIDLFGEREIEIENIAGGREGGGLGNDLELASEMEMGESWGWDVISRVEAYGWL